MARTPDLNRMLTATKSTAGGSKIMLAVSARTSSAGPAMLMKRSVWWMPTAVIMPAGALVGLSRQLSFASRRKLSWLALVSKNRSLPSVPASTIRLSSSKAGSHRRSWPTPSTLPALRGRFDHPLRAGPRHGQRLLAEEVLAGGDDAERLLLVQLMRNCEHDAFDVRIGERLVERSCRA